MHLVSWARFHRVMAVAVSAFLLLGIATTGATAQPAGFSTDRVDAFVTSYLQRHGLPGAGVAVTQDGETVHEAGYGVDSAGEPITEHSRMRIESVSKSFTAFAVLQLVEDDLVDLDQPVQDYLPGFQPDDPRAGEITVRQLLSHTSGLPSPTLVRPAATLEEGVERVRDWHLDADPGAGYRYSNLNYWTAALLVQEVSGEDFSDYLRDHIFAPLQMTDSQNTTTTEEQLAGLPRGHVTAYGGALPTDDLIAMSSGAGGVISTAHDMARWLALQSEDGATPDGTQLLSPELLEESRTRQPNAANYGLGWARSGAGITPERIQHSGAGSSYQAQQTVVPSQGRGVVVLLNSLTPTHEHAYGIVDGILAIMDGEDPEAGAPVPTIIDLVLAALTVGVVALGVRGVLRSSTWVERRRHRGPVFFVVRQLPQLIMPALAVLLFLVTPAVQNNSSVPADAFSLYPAATILVLVAALVCSAQVVVRSIWRLSE